MAITDKLRAGVHRMNGGWCCIVDTCFDELCDRIDAEHERECNEQYVCGVEHGIGASIEASMIQDRGYIELPKDADGEYIHIGDVMEFSAFEIEKPVTRMVDGIGQGVFFAWCGERGYQQHEAKRYRHHKQPTVEDVLTEFGIDWEHESDCEDRAALLAEYAAKLRLAEEVDA